MPSLKASSQGLDSIKQRRKAVGWAIEDTHWLTMASQILDPTTDWTSSAFAAKGLFAPGVSLSTWKRFLRGEAINARVFKAFCQLLELDWQMVTELEIASADAASLQNQENALHQSTLTPDMPFQDWGEAPDVSCFYGRENELTTLRQWITGTSEGIPGVVSCQLIAILGMGGIGKTTLVTKLARELVGGWMSGRVDGWISLSTGSRTGRVGESFDRLKNRERERESGRVGEVKKFPSSSPPPIHPSTHPPIHLIWRSLRSAPPIGEILTDLLQCLTQQQLVNVPPSFEGKLSLLMSHLQQQRCLILLDNFEAVLEGGAQAGSYRAGYEGYGELLKQVGEVNHDSCVVLTSREKPREIARQESGGGKVRSLSLRGLSTDEGQAIFQDRDCAEMDETVCQQIVEHFAGNPLALKIAAAAVQELFAGDARSLIPYLQEGRLKFDDIFDVLERQFERLTDAEQHILYWLCINREATALSELEYDIVVEPVRRGILTALTSLVRRCMVERSDQGWFLQPVVMEFMTEKFIIHVCQEITEQNLALFKSHALIKATSKDYVRQTQVRLILQPIARHLTDQLGNQKSLEFYLNRILADLQQKPELPPNYAAGNLLNLFCHLQTDITGYDFSHLTVWQADLQDANLSRINFSDSDVSRSAFTELFAGVISLAFSPDGRFLAIADTSCEIKIWEIATGKHQMTLRAHASWVWSMVFSPDARLLVSGSDDYVMKVWNLKTGQCLQTCKGPPNLLNAVCFAGSSDMTRVTLAGQDSAHWEPATLAQQIEARQGRGYLVRSLTYSPTAPLIALSTQSSAIELWNLETGEQAQVLEGHQAFARLLKFSPDGSVLASVNYSEESNAHTPEIKIWDVQTGQCQQTLQGHTGLVNDFAWSSDGRWLATVSSDQTIKLWDLEIGECTRTFLGHSNRILSIAFSPDDQMLASGGDDRTVKLWDIHTGRCVKTLQGYTNAIYSMAMAGDRQTIATAHEDESIKLWDLSSGTVFRTLRGHTNRVWCVAFPSQITPDSNAVAQLTDDLMASSSADYTIKLWNWRTGQCLKTLRGHTNWVWSVAFSSNGETVASGSYDRTVKLWDVQTGDCLQTLQGETGAILPVLFSADGQQLFSGDYGGRIRRWDVQTGDCLQTWEAHEGRIFAIALHPTQPQLVTGGNDQTIKRWDLQTGKCLQTFQGHQAAVTDLRFTTDGMLISASFDQTIRIWDLASGECMKTLQGHQSVVSSIIYDGHLFSSSVDATVRQWDLETGNLLKTMITPRPYEGMQITGAIGLTEAERMTLKALGAIEV